MSEFRAALRYGPAVASAVTGVPRVTLRSWRKRYHFPNKAAEPGNSRGQALGLAGLASLKLFALLLEKGVPGAVAADAATAVRNRLETAIGPRTPQPELLVLGHANCPEGPAGSSVVIARFADAHAAVTKAARIHLAAVAVDLVQVVASVERGFGTWRLAGTRPTPARKKRAAGPVPLGRVGTAKKSAARPPSGTRAGKPAQPVKARR
jgi:hypothetical protein